MSKWQPIETAPKDGRDVILGWIPNWPTVEHMARAAWDAKQKGWTLWYVGATHWKPAPPNNQGNRSEPA